MLIKKRWKIFRVGCNSILEFSNLQFFLLKVDKSRKIVFILFHLHGITRYNPVPQRLTFECFKLAISKGFFLTLVKSVYQSQIWKKWMKKHECILPQNKSQYHTTFYARSFKNFELKNWRVAKTPLVPNLLALWLRSPEPYLESLYAKQCLFVQTVARPVRRPKS